MTAYKERMVDELLEAMDIKTRELFPGIYDGFREADALAQGEDAILGEIKDAVFEYFQNRNLETITEGAAEIYETRLGLTHTGTMDERRSAIMEAINRRFVLNDATLHELCKSLAPDFTVYERTDPQTLTLGIFTEEETETGGLPAVGIVDGIRPTVPQNLALYAGIDTAFERPVAISHAHFSALWAGLGTVERHVPKYDYIVMDTATGRIKGGSQSRMEFAERTYTVMDDTPMAYAKHLRHTVMPQSGFVVINTEE